MTKATRPRKRRAAIVIPACLREYYANSAGGSVLEHYRTGNYHQIIIDLQCNRLYDGPGQPREDNA